MARKGFAGRVFRFAFKSMGKDRRRRGKDGRLEDRDEYDVEDLADILSLLPRFNEAGWEEDYTDIIDSAQDYAGNAGQYTILTDYFPDPAKKYCKDSQEEYNPDEFIAEVKYQLGDDKYYAINLIIEEVADVLQEAWDVNYYNDNFLEGLGFSGAQPIFEYGSSKLTKNRIYGSGAAAYNAYSAAAARNGYKLGPGVTPAQRAANRNLRTQSLIRLTGSGKTKPFIFDKNDVTRTAGYGEYKSSAAARGITIGKTTAVQRANNRNIRRQELIRKTGPSPTRPWIKGDTG